MRLSEQWLRAFLDPGVDTATLAHRLTMAGLKVDAVEPAGAPLDGVVAGRVVSVNRHPEADKLTVCVVEDGKGTRTIICGANNVHAGMIAPLALPGASLPGVDSIIAEAEIRGVRSQGMLCSGRELGLSDDHSGLYVLPHDLVPGTPLGPVLGADDRVLEIDLTPNRGDCLSVLGVAREVAVTSGVSAPRTEAAPVKAVHDRVREVRIAEASDCSCYVGRIVTGVDTQRPSPLWMQERLRRAGIRPLGAAVDVTAYVMLELGQPMHAFDLAKLSGTVSVRRAQQGESLVLLDGQEVSLDADVLVIADETGPVAMAGVMGGEASAVDPTTRDVFLESAHFAPLTVAGRARRFGLHTEASQRFERGVDPALPLLALEYATRLLVDIAGGEPGPVTFAGSPSGLHREPAVVLRRDRVRALLGVEIEDSFIEATLERLGMHLTPMAEGWSVRAPSWRFDIAIEADLIEELARLYGYHRIPARDFPAPMVLHPVPDARIPAQRLDEALIQRGYQQVVTYSFVDPALQAMLGMGEGALDLTNPISSELAQMRTGLWPGLLTVLSHNVKRQQGRVRIFESGLKFIFQDYDLKQIPVIGGLIYGERHPLQWGVPGRVVDFYDLKSDVQALFAFGGKRALKFVADAHPALHPGQSARVELEGRAIGWIGVLHPSIAKDLDLPRAPVVFELDQLEMLTGAVPKARPVSRFPALRRDLALVVPEEVNVEAILAMVDAGAPEWLVDRFVFDIYRGKGVEAGRKSVALGLILQETSRTLTDSEADGFVQTLVAQLGRGVNATLRD